MSRDVQSIAIVKSGFTPFLGILRRIAPYTLAQKFIDVDALRIRHRGKRVSASAFPWTSSK